MSLQDRYEFLTKLNYSEQEKQAINLYYEKLNKSKSKDEDIIDTSDENLDEARNSLLKLLEENDRKQYLDFN
ncbi:hypothetical protein [Aliarcobacter cryaerophilus]|uniref:hypothetical protein n=1 Tax=Aliarcobacter cryaerophilus TaxID=28198 RepID=UPI003BAE4334